ncbi:MAG: TonB-dependent receptor, partial [Anaerolineales bacterium]|nr:TonB-dependent receptor [Anaerolineales bacterium]
EGMVVDSGYNLYTEVATVNEFNQIRYRTGGSLLLDYSTDNIKVKFNNFYARMINDGVSRAHSANFTTGSTLLNMSDASPVRTTQTHSFHTTFKILGSELNFIAAYNLTKSGNEGAYYNFGDTSQDPVPNHERLFAQPSYLLDEFIDMTEVFESTMVRMKKTEGELKDKTGSLQLDWKMPYRLGKNISGFIKVGGKYSSKNRSNDIESKYIGFTGGQGSLNQPVLKKLFPDILLAEEVGFLTVNGIPYVSFIDHDYEYREMLDGRYELGWTANIDYLNEVNDAFTREYPGNYWSDGLSSYRSDYWSTEQLSAAYIMSEINIGKRLMLLPGVRFENMHTSYTAYEVQINTHNYNGIEGVPADTTTFRHNAYWFPSINMKFKLNDWSDIRAAYFKSTTRPAFSQMSPAIVYPEYGNILANNPAIKPALANNYDLGLSIYTNKIGLFTINAFYKEINGLIFRMLGYNPYYKKDIQGASEEYLETLPGMDNFHKPMLIGASTRMHIPVNNSNTTYFQGLEFSLQTNFWYLPGVLKGLVLNLNYSRIWSTTSYPYIDVSNGWDTTGIIPIPTQILTVTDREGRMIQQPKDIFNAGIGWDFRGFSSRLSFRYQGETLSVFDTKYSLRDQYTADLFRIDLSLKQKITDKLSVHADFANINKHIDDAFIQVKGMQLPTQSEYYGYTIQFGIRYVY